MRQILPTAALTFLWATTAGAACNNPKNLLESPNEGVKVFVGYQQELSTFASTLNGRQEGQFEDKPYPPPLPAEMIDKPWQGKLSKETNFISYYEPDGKGNWRMCRQEKWGPRDSDPVEESETQNQGKNPAVRPWLKTHFMGVATVYLYDAKGRISETFVALSQEKKGTDPTGERQCFRFDAKDRAELYVRATTSNACPKGEPDLRDNWVRYRYIELKDGRVTDRWVESHSGQPDKTWKKRITFHILIDPNNKDEDKRFQGGSAEADSDNGVTQILAAYHIGEKDESDSYRYKLSDGSEGGSSYYFTRPPVPMAILDNPDKIYDYDRRRETAVTNVIYLLEFFQAGRHRTRDRIYVGAGRTVRHEQYDEAGKLKRAINLGKFSRKDMDMGFYDENLLGAGISLKLTGHELYYRVWDYDDKGKPKLVALGWNDKFRPGMREAVDFAEIIYGTPDGKQKWKTEEEFFKAFDFDPNAIRAYQGTKGKE
jgi:hypothetical protein